MYENYGGGFYQPFYETSLITATATNVWMGWNLSNKQNLLPSTPKAESNMEWLDRRVREMRVAL